MGVCLSRGKTSDPKTNGPGSGGGNGNGNGIHHYQKSQEPMNQYKKSPAQVAQPRPPSPYKPAPSPRPVQRPGSILGKPYEDVKSYYALGKELGRGQFGVTYLCTEISTGQKYACKSISKRKLISKNDREDMKREIQIMQHLSGQPNIVEFKGAYEDKNSVHLVMELCAGGELFDRIIAKGHYSERAAASICRAIVNVVHICHFMGVMHRDLKPENFLLSDKSEHALLKATDFGLSVFIQEGEFLVDCLPCHELHSLNSLLYIFVWICDAYIVISID